jgi:hypothetical protein
MSHWWLFLAVCSNRATRWRSWLSHCSRRVDSACVSTMNIREGRGEEKVADAHCWQPYRLFVPIVLKSGRSSTSWNPQGLSRSVHGLLYILVAVVRSVWCRWCSNLLRPGRSGVEPRWGKRFTFLHIVSDRPQSLRSFLYCEHLESFLGYSTRNLQLTTHPL